MNLSVERLSQILGAPEVIPAQVPWELAPERINIQLPSDYKEFVNRYGSVRILGELSLWIPSLRPSSKGSPSGFEGFVWDTAQVAEELALAYEDDPDEQPYPVFPEAGGLLAWGNNANGSRCFWLTEGDDPDKWPVVIWYQEIEEWDRIGCCMTDFLATLLTGGYRMMSELIPASANAPLWSSQGDWNWTA
ncbi:SMI1/KNR4 family protein [Kitasatospora sp. GP82]|uniref:SMI1/KNR4 family protein n=1 Tax=Kitasatospora sp. GP82 TaxID=3035089 RepID=UPI0024745DE4|nr:SMI1/KNR4 family protein [Kitasatospora sp. GP82]MDH6129273.1 hypothetical protein [Kitasatospora sp. GP82]